MPKIQPWLLGIARTGFIAQGSIYVSLGLLALGVVMGFSSKAEDVRGTLEEISRQPFGTVVLLALAVGLLSLGVWKTVQCAWDPERIAADKYGWALRTLFGLSALLHFGLAWKTAGLGLGYGWSGESGDEAVRSWVHHLLTMPGGRWLVLLAATITAGLAVSQIIRLVRGRFMEQFSEQEMSGAAKLLVKTMARYGFIARTMVVILVAWFLWSAGITADAEKAGGMSKALASLLQQPFGPWLLGFVGGGMVAQGVYIWLMVPYRDITVERDTTAFRQRLAKTVSW